MTNLISSQSSHWYAFKGGIWSPCHEVSYADPTRGMRKTTLTDARKLQLVPSVTGITNVVAAPGLNNWKETQAVLAALTLPRQRQSQPDYITACLCELGVQANDARAVIDWCRDNPPRPVLNDDEFALEVVEDMQAQAEAAKKLGSEIHDAIATILRGHATLATLTPEIYSLITPVHEWIMENVTEVHAVEKIVGSLEHGYAGTLDLDCELKGIGPAILDWKSQNVKRNGNGPKPEFYLSYGKQLAAYAIASVGLQNMDKAPMLVSVIIDKANAGEVFVKVWDNPSELWAEFLNNCATWRFENKYDPRVKDEEDFKALTKIMNEK